MTWTTLCPQCGSELPADALQGLCPHCLIQGGLSSATPPRDSASTTGPGAAFSAPTPAELALMFPQLEIIELLGQRGMGAVYKARQVKLDRFVALKVLPPASGQDPAFVERFALRSPCLACRTTCRGGSYFAPGAANIGVKPLSVPFLTKRGLTPMTVRVPLLGFTP